MASRPALVWAFGKLFAWFLSLIMLELGEQEGPLHACDFAELETG